MTELFIIELHMNSRHTFTTSASTALGVNEAIRPHTYTRAKVTHWIKDGWNHSVKTIGGWRKHREIAEWY